MQLNQTLASSLEPHGPEKAPWLLGSGWRPIALVLLALALPMAAFAGLIVMQVSTSLDEQTVYFNRSTARLAGRLVEERFQGSAHYLQSYAGRLALRRAVATGDDTVLHRQLYDLVEGNPTIDRALVVAPNGRLVGDFPMVPGMKNQDFSFREWFQGVQAKQDTYVSGLYLRSAAPQRHTVAIATPIRDGGRTLGYLVGQHTLETLATWLSALTPSAHGHVLLADPHGQLAVPPSQAAHPSPRLRTLEGGALGDRLLRGEFGTVSMNDPLSNRPSLIETMATPTGWSVVVSQPLEDTHALLRTLNRTVAWLSVVFAGGMATLGLFWLGTIRRYQEERTAAAAALNQRAIALEAANTELRQADRYKDEFLSVVSHELRTPLNGVIGFASILDDELCGPLTPDQRLQVQRIMESGDRMMGMVNNLLEMSRIQAGAFSLSPGWVSVEAIVGTVYEALQARAVDAGIRLEHRVEVPPELCLDGDRLRLALTNLVDNALKFTPSGGTVRMSARWVEGALHCEVSDSGVGLHSADTTRIFERFRQVDMSATRQVGGTGLGLAIVKAIAEAHGGTTGVRSTPGRGSTFWLTLLPMPDCPPL